MASLFQREEEYASIAGLFLRSRKVTSAPFLRHRLLSHCTSLKRVVGYISFLQAFHAFEQRTRKTHTTTGIPQNTSKISIREIEKEEEERQVPDAD